MITTHKESRYTVTMYTFGQFTDKRGSLFMIDRLVYTIAIENYKIIVDMLYLFT